MAEIAKESGHWYTPAGDPAYEVPYADPKKGMRPTTLRDAKKLGLIPSVTTIMKESNKPGLNVWLIDQAIMAALTLNREENEPDASYLARVKKDAAEHGKKAAEKGTHIHGVIERGLSALDVEDEDLPYVMLAKTALDEACPDKRWSHEKSFARERYAGKVDLHDIDSPTVIDIKTNEKPVADAKLWDDHLMQLAAYGHGLYQETEFLQAGILFINHKDMEAKIVWATTEQLEKGWEMFVALTNYFYAKKQLRRG